MRVRVRVRVGVRVRVEDLFEKGSVAMELPLPLLPLCPTALYHAMLWYTPSLRTRVPSLSKTVGCIVLVLGVGRCAFRPPRVVFVLGLVSLINSLTSGKKFSRLLRKGLSTPLFCACLPRRALALAAGAAAPRAPEATGPPAHRRGPYARCTALLAWTTHRRALRGPRRSGAAC